MQICLGSLVSKVTTIWTWQMQVGISRHHQANAARWFTSLIFLFWGAFSIKSKKNYSLHWVYIDLFFPKESAQPDFGQKLLWEEPRVWAKTSRSFKLFKQAVIPFFKRGVCILDFHNTSLRYTALSILVTDSMPTFLNQLFREWPFEFSEHTNYHTFLTIFKNQITLQQWVTVESTHKIKGLDYQDWQGP